MESAKGNQRIFLLRHGESEAIAQGVIVSTLANGATKYGLTATGRSQAAQAGEKIKNLLSADHAAHDHTMVVFSPFLRTKETASIAARQLKNTTLVEEPRIRERDFGTLELMDHENYSKVWEEDPALLTLYKVESIAAVGERMLAALIDLRERYHDRHLVLVSHGDPLKTLQAIIEGRDTSKFKSLSHFQTGEMRELLVS